jgi:hypothetical protein
LSDFKNNYMGDYLPETLRAPFLASSSALWPMFLAVLPAFLVSSSVFRFALSKIDDKLSPPKKTLP